MAGDGDDLLIAGYTAFDTNTAALRAILAEWTSHRDRDYATRIANLSGPRANGHFFLNVDGPQTTVFDDADEDKLTGGSGRDWFFANRSGNNNKDKITDLFSDEANGLTQDRGDAD
jgi:Ca2+-binding RTX toxin-like protein